MTFNTFSTTLEDKLCLGYTKDLKIIDYKITGETTSDFLFKYNQVPTRKNIINFINANFNRKLIPDIGSLKIYTEFKAISIAVKQVLPIRPINTKMNMVKITANTFLDSDNQTIWNITNNHGEKCLQKVTTESIDAVIQARLDIFSLSDGLKFNRLTAAVAGDSVIEIGDIISWKENKKLFTGKILKITNTNYLVQTELGETWSIDVKEITKHEKPKSPELQEYLEKAYGEEYGSLFFKN